MVGQLAARRAAGIVLEMVKVRRQLQGTIIWGGVV